MSAHVRLGGSKAHRWLACPASPRLEELAGPDEAGPHAREGTAAHLLGELCLTENRDPADLIGQFLAVDDEGTIEVTADMAEAVEVYVKWGRNIIENKGDGHVYLERSFNMDALNPPEEMRGSADFVALLPAVRTLVVGDYKHGRGHVVEVKGNKQTRYYALGALLSLPPEEVKGLDRVQMTIVQPRAFHPDGPIRSETVGLEEILDYAEDILQAAKAAQEASAQPVPGDHCLFCRAASSCPAKAERALAVARDEFTAELLPPVETLPVETVAAMVAQIEPKLELVESWLKAAKKSLQEKLEAGDSVPGFKLVAKRATRIWSNPEKVKQWALLDAGLKESDVYTTPELISPAQMEKLVGKKNLPAELTSSVSSGYTLAPESSAKPAARISAADEFSTVNA